MTTMNGVGEDDLIVTTTRSLSQAIERILKRFPDGERPSKLLLLNDLAGAIRPGANWGALKAAALASGEGGSVRRETPTKRALLLAPHAAKGARVLPARLHAMAHDPKAFSLAEDIEDVLPLFDLTHDGEPIIGLEVVVEEGNGYADATPWPNLFVLSGGRVERRRDPAIAMEDKVARLVFAAVQNVAALRLYPLLAQLAAHRLHVIFGPARAIGVFPVGWSGGPRRDLVAAQAARVVAPADAPLAAGDLDAIARLMGAALPTLGLEDYGALDGPVRFVFSEPRDVSWKALSAKDLPANPASSEFLWRGPDGAWRRDDFHLAKGFVMEPYKLDEALDLTLAALDVDELEHIFLHAVIAPPRGRSNKLKIEPGWRGSLLHGWRIVRLRPGSQPEEAALPDEISEKIAAGLEGWAAREGYNVAAGPSRDAVEVLIPRPLRRASNHLDEVRALVDVAPIAPSTQPNAQEG
jgi:hypothetical protein